MIDMKKLLIALIGVLVVGVLVVANLVKEKAPVDVNGPGIGGCFVGGCSGQLCTEERGTASTCEWREEYACYAKAKCERQQNGECGWTPNPEFNMCLQNAQ